MRILGIDPGSIICGYGIIEQRAKSKGHIVKSKNSKLYANTADCIYIASGRIASSPESPLHLRLKELRDTLIDIIREYTPKEMVVERIFFAKCVKTALDLGQVRGIALLCAASEGLNIYEYSALEVKKAITGYGRAEKKQVREMVMRILNLNSYQLSAISLTEDSADALALALCHINTVKFNKASSTP